MNVISFKQKKSDSMNMLKKVFQHLNPRELSGIMMEYVSTLLSTNNVITTANFLDMS